MSTWDGTKSVSRAKKIYPGIEALFLKYLQISTFQ